jgi:hypothetical protein
VDEDAKSQAAKEAWRALREAETRAAGAATPDTFDRLQKSDKAFSELSSLKESLVPRAAADDSVGNIGTAAVSAAAGAAINPAMGVLATLGSGTNNAVRQATGGVAHDIFSNVMHPTGRALSGVGDTLANPAATKVARFAGAQAGEVVGGETPKHSPEASFEQALSANPQALGPYAAELQQAALKGELHDKIEELFDRDENFRKLHAQVMYGD